MNEEKAVMPDLPPATDLSIIGPPPKRKKGRPPKNRALLPGGEGSAAPVPPKPDGRGRKPKQKYADVVWPAVDTAYVGQQVHGVLDGSFDAGYLLTVRVGNTQTVLRGAVFEPSLSVPISESNDIAPHIKFISRGDLPAPPLPHLTEHASANVAIPSSSVEPPVSSGNNNTPPVLFSPLVPSLSSGDNNRAAAPSEEDKRPPSKVPPAPLAESLCVPSGGVAEDNQKDMTPLGVGTYDQKDLAPTEVPSGVGSENQKDMGSPHVPLGVAMDVQRGMAPSHLPLGVVADNLKGTAPSVHSRENPTKEMTDIQVEPSQP